MMNPPHPGELLKEDVITALGLSVTETVSRLGMSRFEKLKHRHVKVIVLTLEPVFEQAHSPEPRRRPAKVPLIRFMGDVIDTVPGSSWDIT